MKRFFDFFDLRGNDPASRFSRGVLFAHIMLIGLMLTPRMFAFAINTMMTIFGPSLIPFILGIAIAAGIFCVSTAASLWFIERSLYDNSRSGIANS